MSKEWYSNCEIDDVIVCPYCGKKEENRDMADYEDTLPFSLEGY